MVAKELTMVKEELTIVLSDKRNNTKTLLKTYMLRRMELLNSCINYQETLRPEFYEYYQFVDRFINEHHEWEKNQILKLAQRGISNEQLDLPGDVSIYAEVLLMVLKGLENDFYIKKEYHRLKVHLDNLTNVIIKGISKN